MHVALIGATGNVGSRILAELVQRRHTVTAIVRDPARVPALSRVEARAGDVADGTELAALLAAHDAVVSAVPFATTDAASLIATVRAAGVPGCRAISSWVVRAVSSLRWATSRWA